MPDIFPLLILNARPAAGKSELIAYLQAVPLEEREERFHIGEMAIFDDFPLLWRWFEEDALLERVFQRPRLYTDSEGYFLHNDLWHLLIRLLRIDYQKWERDHVGETTAILEFSRGEQHGGYRAAYPHLGKGILSQAALLYLQVPYQESLRKNQARYNPDRPGSILEHSLPESKLERLYRHDDFQRLAQSDPHLIPVLDQQVPYAIMPNEDDVTTRGGKALGQRLERSLDALWSRWSALHSPI